MVDLMVENRILRWPMFLLDGTGPVGGTSDLSQIMVHTIAYQPTVKRIGYLPGLSARRGRERRERRELRYHGISQMPNLWWTSLFHGCQWALTSTPGTTGQAR